MPRSSRLEHEKWIYSYIHVYAFRNNVQLNLQRWTTYQAQKSFFQKSSALFRRQYSYNTTLQTNKTMVDLDLAFGKNTHVFCNIICIRNKSIADVT